MGPAVGRIRGRATFRALARPAGRGRSGPLSVSFAPGDGMPPARVAYAIGRRHGNAVHRNRLRRRLRAAVRMAIQPGAPLPPGAYLVAADPAAAGLAHAELARRVAEALFQAASGRAASGRAAEPSRLPHSGSRR